MLLPHIAGADAGQRRKGGGMSGLEPLPSTDRGPLSPDSATQWQRIVWPVVVFIAGILLWDLTVRVGEIPPYLLPGPFLVFRTLVADWPILSASLGVTLLTALEGFIAAAIGGIALALLFNQSKWLEYSLLPYAIVLQVTPVIAI
eukprot:gene303-425_t